MLYVYTKLNEVDDKNYVNDVEAFFNFDLAYHLKPDPIVNKILQEIDGAHIISDDIVETKFGRTLVMNLSTGCKALLVAVKNPGLIVNFIEAGNNVNKLALELSDKLDIKIYTKNALIFSKHLDRIVNFDGKEITAKQVSEYTVFGRS